MKEMYHEDPYLLQFNSNVTGIISEKGRVGVLTENTVFYPEGGGQPADRGTLVCARRTYEVVQVEQRPEGIVHWIAGLAGPSKGTRLLMTVDAERRRDHMQQHHGQHILSAVLEQQYGWETIGFHLGEETNSIDLTVRELPLESMQQAEAEANRIVLENLPVQSEFYSREQLPPELLRKLPPNQEEVRLVVIPGVDENACCGTHPRFTGEAGPIKLLKTESVRGHTRLYFICGLRTVHWMWQTARSLKELEETVGAVGTEAVTRLQKREAEFKKLQKEHKELLPFKYQAMAQGLKEKSFSIQGTSFLVELFPQADMDFLRGLAAAWCREPKRTALLAGGDGPYAVVFGCSPEGVLAADQLAEFLWPLLQGQGGGNAGMVQGRAREWPQEKIINQMKQHFSP